MIHDSGEEADMSESLRVGAYGWRHDHWASSFYAEELPDDWRLTFYANEFSAVLVPSDYLGETRDIEQWCEDVSESFRFYIEWPKQVDSEEALVKELAQMGEKLGGILLDSDIDLDIHCPKYCWQRDNQPTDTWQPDHSIDTGLAVFPFGQSDLRQQRQWLESFVEDSKGCCRAILVTDDKLDIQTLRELKTLVELKGL